MTTAANRAACILTALASALYAGATAAEAVAVVSARSSVTSLTKNQVADIFLGKASRFPDGGPAVPIDQVEGSASREDFYLRIAGKSPAQLNAHWSKIIFTGRGQPPREAGSAAELKKLVAANPNAIGYIEENLVDATLRAVSVQP
jgi:ABC-type phosphate transport system substrate-binding protein